MRIENIKTETSGDKLRAVADVTWEDCDRPPHQVWFETVLENRDSFWADPHAFLICCAIPAQHFGEQRVFIDAEVCSELKTGLTEVLGWLHHWFPGQGSLPVIECRPGVRFPDAQKPDRAGFCFTGGIDSFASLRLNRLNYPQDHPRYIKDGLLVYGLEMDIPEAFDYVEKHLAEAAQELGVNLLTVSSNQYLLYREDDARDKWSFWLDKFMGPALAAAAHTFSRRFTLFSVGSAGYGIAGVTPHGSHPLIESNCSSCDLMIRHDAVHLTRYQKTRLLSDWEPAMKYLRVCNQFRKYSPEKLNCGQCDKCLRTMLTLLSLGALERTPAFPGGDVDIEQLQGALRIKRNTIVMLQELLSPLKEMGRTDLADFLEQEIDHYLVEAKKRGWGRVLRKQVGEWDRKYLKGVVHRLSGRTD